MKNRLILLALAMLCYGNIQATNLLTNYRNWPPIREKIKEDIKNFSPYSSIGSLTQYPAPTAQRIAALERLYEEPMTFLEEAYDKALNNAFYSGKYPNKTFPIGQWGYATHNKIDNLINAKSHYDKLPFGQYLWKLTGNESRLKNLRDKAVRLHLQEPSPYYVEANSMNPWLRARKDFRYKLKKERRKGSPLYEYFQHPSRNILGEY